MTPHDLLAAFDVLAEAPGGIQRLRALVLELAVRGKLVPQDPNDEPASVLLERIAAEKARLVKAGKLRASMPLSPVKEKEKPFKIPNSWLWVRFGAVSESRLGKMLDKSKNRGSYRPYLRNANVRWFRIDLDDVLHIRIEDAELEEHSLRVGDLLICEGGEPGRAAICDELVQGMVFQKALHRARPYPGVLVKYLAYILRRDTWSGWLEQYYTGATIKHFTGKSLDTYVLPLPSTAEQQRIVTRVDEMMALLDKLEAARILREDARLALRDTALAALRDAPDVAATEVAWARVAEHLDNLFTDPADLLPLRQTILQLAVRGKLVPQNPRDEPASVLLERITAEKTHLTNQGKFRASKPLPPAGKDEVPFDVPLHWAWCLMSSLTAFVTSGSRSWNQYYSEHGASFIRAQDIKYDRLEFDQRVFVDIPEGVEGSRTQVNRDDLLLTITGANVGKCAFVSEELGEAYVSQHVALIRPLERLMVPFLHLWLTGDFSGRQLLLGESYGAKPGLNLNQIRELRVPVPPLAEQRRIVAKIDELMAMCDALEARLRAVQDAQAAFAAAAVHHLDT